MFLVDSALAQTEMKAKAISLLSSHPLHPSEGESLG